MNKSLFIPAPFFLMRTPMWPIEKLEQILSEENWIEALLSVYENDQLLREAIAIASPSLYRSLQAKPLKDPYKTAISLLNYVTRMATRATPFGLFSFVGTGHWSPKTEVLLDATKIYKIARPDMEWVYSLIEKMYKEEGQFLSLSVQTNPLLYFKGERIYLNYLREGKGNSDKIVSISTTLLVRNVLKEAQNPISISQLLEKVEVSIPQLNRNKANPVLQELLANQFLLPAILPSLLSPCPAEVSLIAREVEAYTQSLPGHGEKKLADLQRQMEGLASAKTYLQVDAAYPQTALQLPSTIGEELAKTASFLWKLSSHKAQFSHIKSYHERFVEKYGIYRTVPLLELLHKEKGLGPIQEKGLFSSRDLETKFTQRWEQWLHNAWQDCLHKKTGEILVDETVLSKLLSSEEDEPKPEKAPLSFDLFYKIIAESPEKIDEGNFSLAILQSSWEGGSSFGRFAELLGPEFKEHMSKLHRQEELLEPNSLFVELSYFPQFPRSANVAIQPCLRTYRLDLQSKEQKPNSLSLHDIYVGATFERLYLTLETGGVEINGCVGNMLNLKVAPEPLRLMREVTLAKKQSLYPFSWGPLSETANFLPRVRFQKSILSLAKWNLHAPDFKGAPLEKIASGFTSWANQWLLPQRSVLVSGDQYLLFDRSCPAHIDQIHSRLRKGEPLEFSEHLETHWMHDKRGHYAPEMTLSFTKNPIYADKNSSFTPLTHKRIPSRDRWKFPASDWLFAKLYLEDEERERFLLQHLVPFAAYLRKESIISGWFFVRYSDPEPHLRFRLHLSSLESTAVAISSLQKAVVHWVEAGLIKNMALTGYEREIERYGGPELIEAAEEIFCADTLATTFLLQASKKQFPYHESILQTLSTISFLRDLGLNQEESIGFLADLQNDQTELKGFREHKQKLISLAEPMLSSSSVEIFEQASLLRRNEIATFSAKALSLSPLTQKIVYKSILHMHCNRLGCNTATEKRAVLYAYQTLLQIQHRSLAVHSKSF